MDTPPARLHDAKTEALLACHQCDLLMRHPALCAGESARCPRCTAVVSRHVHASLDRSLAWAMTGAVLLLPAFALPVVSLSIMGRQQSMTLIEGTAKLFEAGLYPLAAFVGFVSVVAPAAFVIATLALLLPIRFGKRPGHSRDLYALLRATLPWGMLDVYLIALLVAYVKLADLARVTFEPGFVAFVGLIGVVALLQNVLSHGDVFDEEEEEGDFAASAGAPAFVEVGS